VLVVVHNITAATRIFDVLPLVAEDDRVSVVFTVIGSSAFDHGTHEFLVSRGVTVIPWEFAVGQDFDLTLAASYGGDLHRTSLPRVIIPHGMGYNKYLAREPGSQGAREPGSQGAREPGSQGAREPGSFWLVPGVAHP